ncbi:MAG: nucleotide exchange factor GrpE [Rikenellaceae bacterium]
MKSNSIENQDVRLEEEVVDNQNSQSEESAQGDNMSQEEQPNQESEDNLAEQQSNSDTEVNVDWKDKYMRLQAEFDNYRKRTLKEKMDLVSIGGVDVIKAFLPLVDDMHRAVDAMGKSDDLEAIRGGVNLIYNKMGEILKNQGVSEIEAVGKELDVDHHEAVARFAAGEDKSGKIIDVVERGYTKGEKVIRFAKVVVGE